MFLGFLFSTACSGDGANIFENLYHHNAQNRIEAMKYLVKNVKKMCFSDDSKNLLRDSISERLSDDSPLVVQEALQFSTADLIEMLDQQQLVDRLAFILQRADTEDWCAVAQLAIKHITTRNVWTDTNIDEIFLALWPFLFPIQSYQIPLLKQIVTSDICEKIPFFKKCRTNQNNIEQIVKLVNEQLTAAKKTGLPSISGILQRIAAIPDKRITIKKAYYSVLMLIHLMPRNELDHKTAQSILNVINQILRTLGKNKGFVPNSEQFYSCIAVGKYPIQLHLQCIQQIIDSVDFKPFIKEIDFSQPTDGQNLIVDIFKTLVNGLQESRKCTNGKDLYMETFRSFFAKVLPSADEKIKFFGNFFVTHLIDGADMVDAVLQVQVISIFNHLLETNKEFKSLKINLEAVILILSGLSARMTPIRECTYTTIEILSQNRQFPSICEKFVQKLLLRREELLLDANQLPIVVHGICFSTKSARNSYQSLCDALFGIVADITATPILRACVLDLMNLCTSSDILRQISNASVAVIDQVHQSNKSNAANEFYSTIIRSILFRFNCDTMSAIKSSTNCWYFLLQCIKLHNVLLHKSDDTMAHPVSKIAMDLIHEEFFEMLSATYRTQLIKEVILVSATAQNAEVLHSAGKLMHRILLDAKYHLDTFHAMSIIDISAGGKKLSERRKSTTEQLSPDIQGTIEWKCGTSLLEYLQNKKNLSNAHLLLPSLFAILKRCLQFEDQSIVEYTKQLVLGCMLHCCQLISPDGTAQRQLIPDKIFEIELVVSCIRGTQNPQTHHHALQLLSHTAAMIPELVLHNMMNIFTFVGSRIARRDDAYTYQITLNIIKSIIPTLIESNRSKQEVHQHAAVIPVLRVFADIILDVPEHRRLRLYEDLLNTLDAKQYLWIFLAVLLESHVRNYNKAVQPNLPERLKRIDIAVEITNQFDCITVLETVTKLVEFLYNQPMEKQANGDSMDIDITDTSIFNVQSYSSHQLKHFKYSTLQYIVQLTDKTSKFVQKMAALDNETTVALKPEFKMIIVQILLYINKLTKLAAKHNEEKYWKYLLTNCYDILDQVLALIYPDMLLQVISGLLSKNNITEVRRKAIELLNRKLQLTDFFANCQKDTLLGLLGK